jgi:hypothetical protein
MIKEIIPEEWMAKWILKEDYNPEEVNEDHVKDSWTM